MLLDSLDGNFFPCNLVSRQCDHTELTLAKPLAHLVVVEEVGEPYGLAQHLDPDLLLLTGVEVENARLAGRQDDLDWVKSLIGICTVFFLDLLHEGAREAVHHAAFRLIIGAAITEDLAAIQDSPVILEAISLGLEETLTLKEDSILALPIILSEEAFIDLTVFIVEILLGENGST